MADEKLMYTPTEYLGKEVPYPYPGFKKVIVYTHKIIGCCPISVEGDYWVFEGFLRFGESKISDDVPNYFEPGSKAVCTYTLQSLHQYMKGMTYGVSAVEMGISTGGEDGYVMCPAWGPPICEATVIYRLHPEPIEKGMIDRFYEHLAKVGHISVPTFYMDKFSSPEAKLKREQQIEEWRKAGKPKFWEGWRNPPCQPRARE